MFPCFFQRSCATVALCGLLGGSPALAGQVRAPEAKVPEQTRLARTATVGPRAVVTEATRPGSVVGGVWDAQDRPMPGVRVRLRDVVTGSTPTAGAADDAGRFSFSGVSSGSYIVEVLGENGKLLTVSHTFNVGPGETVATFVRLGAKVPGARGFFRNAASAVVLTAAAAGVTAIGPEAKPCSSPSPGCD